MKQHLLWMPKAQESSGTLKFQPLTLEDGEPKRVWSLYEHSDESKKPPLPYKPKHLTNAFLEDKFHDWRYANGVLHFYTRISTGGHWLLLEYPD